MNALTLPAEQPTAYVHLDNRGLVICNGEKTVLFSVLQGRWAAETLDLIAHERRATRIRSQHILGGFAQGPDHYVLYAGLPDDMVSVRLSAEAFGLLRSRLASEPGS